MTTNLSQDHVYNQSFWNAQRFVGLFSTENADL